MDVLTPDQRHKAMKNIKNKDTSIEVALRRALWKKGYRYRKNYKNLPGKPDIVFLRLKIAIFCDGELFHGKNWEKRLRFKLMNGHNPNYWVPKISKNIQRDMENNHELMSMGWIVLRFWGLDIQHNLDKCVHEIEEAIKYRRLEYDEDKAYTDYINLQIENTEEEFLEDTRWQHKNG